MKKRYIVLLALVGCLPLLWIIARLTNALQFYSAPTTSNYPTIKMGDVFFGTNLAGPKRFDFICYSADIPQMGRQIMTHRLCGLAGDTVEIRKGDLYINNRAADSALTLAHIYTFPAVELPKLAAAEKLDESFTQQVSNDSVVTYASDKTIKDLSIKARKTILEKDYNDELISDKYRHRWNQDNFGPVVVPENKYFVLGDNRSFSQDSRYQGFIDKSAYLTTVLGRK